MAIEKIDKHLLLSIREYADKSAAILGSFPEKNQGLGMHCLNNISMRLSELINSSGVEDKAVEVCLVEEDISKDHIYDWQFFDRQMRIHGL